MNQQAMSRQGYLFTWITIIGVVFFASPGISQDIALLRSTLSTGGSSGIITIQGNSYLIQQSIGQGSVTGTVQPSLIQLRQGFIQPHDNFSKNGSTLFLQVTIFPNQFSTALTIDLPENTGQLSVMLSDVLGRVVFHRTFEGQQQVVLEPGTLPSGYYILKINSGSMTHVSKLIKE